jgi:predicted Na+-dependent transporter
MCPYCIRKIYLYILIPLILGMYLKILNVVIYFENLKKAMKERYK